MADSPRSNLPGTLPFEAPGDLLHHVAYTHDQQPLPDFDRLTELLLAAIADDSARCRLSGLVALDDSNMGIPIPVIVPALRRADRPSQQFLLMCLGWIGSHEAIDALISLLEEGDDEVRALALFVLGEFGREPAVAHVTSMLSDPADIVRSTAQFSLAWNQGQIRIDKLTSAREGSDDTARSLADRALAKIGIMPVLATVKVRDATSGTS